MVLHIGVKPLILNGSESVLPKSQQQFGIVGADDDVIRLGRDVLSQMRQRPFVIALVKISGGQAELIIDKVRIESQALLIEADGRIGAARPHGVLSLFPETLGGDRLGRRQRSPPAYRKAVRRRRQVASSWSSPSARNETMT